MGELSHGIGDGVGFAAGIGDGGHVLEVEFRAVDGNAFPGVALEAGELRAFGLRDVGQLDAEGAVAGIAGERNIAAPGVLERVVRDEGLRHETGVDSDIVGKIGIARSREELLHFHAQDDEIFLRGADVDFAVGGVDAYGSRANDEQTDEQSAYNRAKFTHYKPPN